MAKIDIFAPQEKNMVSSLAGVKITIAGSNDTGKSYTASHFPKPLLLMVESGGAALPIPKFPVPDWQTFATIVKQLVADPERTLQVYQTVIIDTTEELVSRAEESVARRFGVSEVGMVQQASSGNPNGYSVARAMFKQQINLLTSIGLTVIFITHIESVDVTDPFTGETYTKMYPYGFSKEKGSTRFVINLCDFVVATIPQGVDPETQKTIYSKAICKETKHVFARSRFSQMQTYIEAFTAENLINAIETAIKREAENEGAGLVEFKKVDFGFTKDDYISMIQPYFVKLIKLYPDYVHDVVEQNLGQGRKISSATDDELQELSNIYSEFNSFCCDRGIVVED